MTQLQVRLHRDSFSRPWGFRLQGGTDIGYPLAIQRVFSNSPAEGELQRGDRILSLGGRPGSQLTHAQAQDIVKRAGGQIDLVVERPPPSRVSSIATFTPAAQRPTRAQSLQPVPRAQSLQPLIMPAQSGLRLNANPCFNPNFTHQYSPSSPHPPPPWTQQQVAPKKVSRLSQLGGGTPDFGVDYGSHYGTVPRRRHSSQIQSFMPQSHYAGYNPPSFYSQPYLGRDHFDFGTDYCTLPRARTRQSSQPPVSRYALGGSSTMPVSSRGFMPKKVTLSRLGGGGPEFGSDFTRYRPSPSSSFMQPMHVQTSSVARVQDSLDNLSLSPRAQEYHGGYQAQTSPGQRYVPTGVRLDMEREQELRKQQQQQQQQHQQQQHQQQQHQQQQQYAPISPQQPQYAPVSPQPQQQMYHFEPQPYQQSYVPTGVRLDHQMGEDEDQGEQLPPVSERRRTFMNAPARTLPAPTGKNTAPKVLRPKPGKTDYSFGVDYTKQAPKTSSVTWKPQPAHSRPVNRPITPPQHEVQPAPTLWSPNQNQHQNQSQMDEPDMPPAWRNTLKTSGVKPWDKHLDYTSGQQAARSVPIYHQPAPPPGPKLRPTAPAPAPQSPRQQGPKVLHLQYNSPMDLYSRDNVQDTFSTQTKAMAAAGAIPPSSTQVQNPNDKGDRDWTQSAVYRMIYEEEHRGRPQQKQPQQQQQQQQQQQKAPPPPPAPKPQAQTFQQAYTPIDGEYGTSDF